MTEQERNVLLNELRQQESQREKQIKRERFRRLNPYVKKGAVVFAGSSLMEQFPLYEFLQDDDLHCTLYNRGIGGFTTTELLEAMDECILELQPAHLFLNIGTNDLNGPDYDRAAMLGRYEEIVQQIRKKLPETKLYLLAYYPVNPTVAEDPGLIECFRWRTNERIREASEGVQALARKYGAEFLDLNKDLCDAAGNLKAEYTIEGMKAYKISTRQAHTRVRLQQGEVLVIGGLMDNRDQQQIQKVPILGDIPLLGKLFRHSRKSKDSVEMLMLVRATVV